MPDGFEWSKVLSVTRQFLCYGGYGPGCNYQIAITYVLIFYQQNVIMADEKYNPLTAYHDDLTRGLNPYIDCLVEKFSRTSLLSEDELADLNAHKGPVKYLLDVAHARKEKHNDSQCFDELVKFMKSLQDARLSELADKMRISEDDDVVPCVQAEQSESSDVEYCELTFVG